MRDRKCDSGSHHVEVLLLTCMRAKRLAVYRGRKIVFLDWDTGHRRFCCGELCDYAFFLVTGQRTSRKSFYSLSDFRFSAIPNLFERLYTLGLATTVRMCGASAIRQPNPSTLYAHPLSATRQGYAFLNTGFFTPKVGAFGFRPTGSFLGPAPAAGAAGDVAVGEAGAAPVAFQGVT